MISRTKKRLSRTNLFVIPAYIVALSGIAVATSFLVQAVRPSPSYGVVYGQIPTMHVPLTDQKEDSQALDYSVGQRTPVIVFGLDSFVFGDLKAFTESFYQADNKFRVDHVDGAPHVGRLLETYVKWQRYRNDKFDINEKRPVILYPVAEMPMEKVIQVMDMLQKTTFINHVILATELI